MKAEATKKLVEQRFNRWAAEHTMAIKVIAENEDSTYKTVGDFWCDDLYRAMVLLSQLQKGQYRQFSNDHGLWPQFAVIGLALDSGRDFMRLGQRTARTLRQTFNNFVLPKLLEEKPKLRKVIFPQDYVIQIKNGEARGIGRAIHSYVRMYRRGFDHMPPRISFWFSGTTMLYIKQGGRKKDPAEEYLDHA